MSRTKILFICGTLNQTTMMYQVSRHLPEHDCYFTPYYTDGFLNILAQNGYLDFSVLGGQPRNNTEKFLNEKQLDVDYGGIQHNYDLVVTCSDLIIPENIKDKKIILVQEGMTDPENFKFYLVKYLGLPRYLGNTSMTGLSDAYVRFCVASAGYKEIFIEKGIEPEKIAVTGIPNFDNCKSYLKNDFPYKHYVLAATSHLRETFKYENRKAFIHKAVAISDGRRLFFKLYPNEKRDRAIQEIERWAPNSVVLTEGNTNHIIANCDVMVTKYSTVLFVALALGKKVYSDLDDDYLEKITPLQNGGKSAENIASPTALHIEQAIDAAEAGCHILMEKPISHTIDRANDLLNIVKQKGIIFQTAFQFRFHPVLRQMKELIDDDVIGKIVSAHVHWGEYLPLWHPWEDYRQGYSARHDLGGGVVLTLCHPFDYLRWLAGEIRSVSAIVDKLSDLEIDTDDAAMITLRFEHGAIGSVYLDYCERPPQHSMVIIGQNGKISWDNSDGIAYLFSGENQNGRKLEPPTGFERNTLFINELAYFIDCIRNNKQPVCTFEDGVCALEIALAAKKSSKERKEIFLP